MVSDAPLQHGIVAVYEYAEAFNVTNNFTLLQKLTFAEQLADLLDYMEHSPLGSLRMDDLKQENVRMVKGHIKLSDIDHLNSKEIECSQECDHGVACENGRCVGLNARLNMISADEKFFRYFLKDNDNAHGLQHQLQSISHKIISFKLTAGELKIKLQNIISHLTYELKN